MPKHAPWQEPAPLSARLLYARRSGAPIPPHATGVRS